MTQSTNRQNFYDTVPGLSTAIAKYNSRFNDAHGDVDKCKDLLHDADHVSCTMALAAIKCLLNSPHLVMGMLIDEIMGKDFGEDKALGWPRTETLL